MYARIKDLSQKLLVIMTHEQKTIGFFVLLGSIGAAILETLGVSAIIPLINALLNPSKIYGHPITQHVCVFLRIQSEQKFVNAVIILVILIYILKNLYFIFYSWIKVTYANKVQRETAVFMLESYLRRGYSFFLTHNTNELRQCVEVDVNSLYNIITSYIQIITQIIISALICAFICCTAFNIAISVILASTLCISIILFAFKRIMTKVGQEYRNYSIISSKLLLEIIHGCKEVFVMGKERFFLEKFSSNLTKRQKARAKQGLGEEIPAYIIEAICITIIMITLDIQIISIEDNTNFIAILASFAVGAFRILPALGKISSSANLILTSTPGLNAIYENVIATKKTSPTQNIGRKIDAEILPQNFCFSDNISIKNISFRYNMYGRFIFENLSINIPCGQSIAFVGESGAGKSTLADIILGLLNIENGFISIDGIDIKKIPFTWSQIIGFVPQSIYLFDATIKENVAFGEDECNIDMCKLNNALKKANLYDYIASLPEGIDTFVGDRGIRLSGGQRQRIGIARALYHNPQILILDEATSALDSDTESAVMEAIDSLHGSMTLIIIAHRITTIKNCDIIYRIEHGDAQEISYQDLI